MQGASLDFDLSRLPEPERFPFWREQGSLFYRPRPPAMTVEPPLVVRSQVQPLGPVTLVSMEASPQDYERTSAMVRGDGHDHFGLVLLEQGTIHHIARGRELTVAAGDLLLMDLSEEVVSRWSAHGQIMVHLPRDVFADGRGLNPRSARLAGDHPFGRLMAAHMRTLIEEAPHATGVEQGAMAKGFISLVQTYFSCHGDLGVARDADGGSDGLLLLSIQRFIAGHLHKSDLNAESIGRHFHLSRSTVYRLFEPWGGVRHFIQEQRLVAALLRLRSQSKPASLADLAKSLGFASASGFSHAFRRRWGITARECIGTVTNEVLSTSASELGLGPSHGDTHQHLGLICQSYYRRLARV